MKDRATESSGQVIVIFAIFLVVLFGAAGLAIDYSNWLVARRDFQSVVDAASLAGAGELPSPGTAAATTTDQENAAVEAFKYLNSHFAWGTTVPSGNTILNHRDPYVVSVGTGFCIWIWTATPSLGLTTLPPVSGSRPACMGATNQSLDTNFPSSRSKVFVRVTSPRQGYFSAIAGLTSNLVGADAVAGGSHLNYAVISLKRRLDDPDNVFGLDIKGSSILNVPVGDVGGNYTLQWGGINAHVTFPNPALDQFVDLAEPQTVQGSGSVTGGAIEQLADYPIEDPIYMTPAPAFCSGPVSGPCQETNAVTSTTGPWAVPPTSGGPTGKGVYPSCARSQDMNNQVLDLSCLASDSSYVVYPGQYTQVKVPGKTTVTLSRFCYGDPRAPGYDATMSLDSDCVNGGRAGVFYFRSTTSGSGLYANGSPTSPTAISGCGVFLVFDPYETGGSRVQFNTAGNGSTVNINNCSNMEWAPSGNAAGTGIPYAWYGFNLPPENPVSMWVRPNRSGYDVTSTSGGSNVITFAAGTTVNENGAIYAPEDNTIVSGGPAGSGVGQIVAWTIVYTGNSTINETYQGPGVYRTRLFQ